MCVCVTAVCVCVCVPATQGVCVCVCVCVTAIQGVCVRVRVRVRVCARARPTCVLGGWGSSCVSVGHGDPSPTALPALCGAPARTAGGGTGRTGRLPPTGSGCRSLPNLRSANRGGERAC